MGLPPITESTVAITSGTIEENTVIRITDTEITMLAYADIPQQLEVFHVMPPFGQYEVNLHIGQFVGILGFQA